MQLLALRFSLQYRYKQLLSVLPLAKGTGFTPFLIVGHGRSGSTWLHTLLSSHPNVWSWGETFRPYRQQGSLQALKEAFLQPYPQKIKAVGSKFFYDDLKEEGGQQFMVEWIDKGQPLIHLYRNNMLRAVVSEQRAWHYQQWSSKKKKQGGSIEKLPFDVSKGLPRMVALIEQKEAMQRRLTKTGSHQLSYEALCQDTESERQKLLQFLGLPFFRLYSPLHQQNAAPLQSLLTNYAEVRAAMEAKGWQKFLA